MAFYNKDDIHKLYTESKDEARAWRKDYHEYERLADNDLIDDLDENLPETNDGSLAAALWKLPKRIVSSKLKGRAKALDADDAWITELANMQWENEIIPNANSQAPFHRKWKDAVRKAAIYGSVPLITLFVENGDYIGVDFVVAPVQDVTLEAGRVSDYESKIIFWDVYYTKPDLDDMIEQAEEEIKEHKADLKAYEDAKVSKVIGHNESEDTDNPPEPYNTWDVEELKLIRDGNQEEERPSEEDHNTKQDKSVKKGGYHFYIAFQRGVSAPFYMSYTSTGKCVREWANPDPTGDVPVHYLYCYQDFINPYGIGIVKLAGGTQNVLDYMRQADVLATQLGLRSPILIEGNSDDVDMDSLVYAQDAVWLAGNAKITRMEIANGVYERLPQRIEMYQSSLNKLIPMGDTSVSAAAGDPMQSKTPAGVKFQAANLSIDDDDFKDNLYMTYEAVARSMINTQFANMQGSDLMKLSDDERNILIKAGLEFPVDEMGNPTNELEVIWDNARATFDFEVDAEQDKAKDDEQRLEGLLKITDFIKDPNTQNLIATGQPIILGNKKIDPGELVAEIVSLASDNEKIIEDVSPEDMEQMEADQLAAEQQMADESMMAEDMQPGMEMAEDPGMEAEEMPVEQGSPLIEEYIRQFNVPENIQQALYAALDQGFTAEEAIAAAERSMGFENA